MSYWTLDVSRVVIPKDAAIYQIVLHVRRAVRVLVVNLPAHWGVCSTNDENAEFEVVLVYRGHDFGASFTSIPLARILSDVEITSGLPFADEMKAMNEDISPDRSKPVEVTAEISFYPKFDPKEDFRTSTRKTQVIEASGRDLRLIFHDVEGISGGSALLKPNQSSEPTPTSVTTPAAQEIAPAAVVAHL